MTDESMPTMTGDHPRGRRSESTSYATDSRPPVGRGQRRGSRTIWPRSKQPTVRLSCASSWHSSGSCGANAASGRKPRNTATGSPNRTAQSATPSGPRPGRVKG